MVGGYPFTALVGQATMKLALVLNAVNPRLGGVLIRGEKGTAKSTAVRGLGDLLPAVSVVEGCRFACDPAPGQPRCGECLARETAGETLHGRERPAAVVDLPIGATEDRVLGTLDLERALKSGERHFDPGLLARANRGLLYVDEVNLLPDHLVDTLLDAAAMGTNTVEREGLSFSHPSAFVLIGTMNPEEGELRPQLLDRFGLAVDVEGMPEVSQRAEVVRRRVAYERDPGAFAARWQAAEQAERECIARARARLPGVEVEDDLLDLIAQICSEFDVDGLRADIVIYKAAATLAAYAGRDVVTTEDIHLAAQLALPHRRRRQPFDTPGLDRDHLQRLVDDHTPSRSPDGAAAPPTGTDRRGDGGESEGAAASDGPHAAAASGQSDGSESLDRADGPPAPDRVFGIAPPPPLGGTPVALAGSTPRAVSPSGGGRSRSAAQVDSPLGRHVRSIELPSSASPRSSARPLDLSATLLAAAPHQLRRGSDHPSSRLRLEPHDVRVKIRQAPLSTRTLFVVDASGSMAAQQRMAAAKGAVVALLTDAYQQRNQVGLIAFRGTRADLLLPLTTSADLAFTRLRDLPTGGRTPLAAALRLAHATLARPSANGRSIGGGPTLMVLVSDGRANVALAGSGGRANAALPGAGGASIGPSPDGQAASTPRPDPYSDALSAASALRAAGISALVVDTEDGPVRLGLARRLCNVMNGRYLRLSDLPTGGQTPNPLAAAVRHFQNPS